MERGPQVITPGAPARDQELIETFRQLKAALSESPPVRQRPELLVKWSAGKGRWSKVPWVAIMDERETTSTRSGVYCVLLFRQDMSAVYLTFAQGVTEPKERLGNYEGVEWVRRRAKGLRRLCPALREAGFTLDQRIDLHTDEGLGKDYEASTVAYKLYAKNAVPCDEQILSDIEAVLRIYDIYLEKPSVAEVEAEPEPEPEAPAVGPEILDDPVPPPSTYIEPIRDLAAVATQFSLALTTSHIHYGAKHDQLVRAFIAALATKRFAILTGQAGSGKTQIAIHFGEWLGDQPHDRRAMLVPIRPDWTGPEPLLGYEDALQLRARDGRPSWHVPDVLKFLLRAARDPENPYLLILDEMNLAHVERYFADILSGIESDQPVLPNLRQEQDGVEKLWRVDPGLERIPFPRNLFVVGTVNVDETTYMFSPKVLDRANTFEFRVESDDLQFGTQKPFPCQPGDPGYVRGFLAIAMDHQWQFDHQPQEIEAYGGHMKRLHRLLQEGGFEFGHRVFYEALRFASMLQSAGTPEMEVALDRQVLQKILPRLHGTRRQLEPLLCALGRFCLDLTYEEGSVESGKATEFNPLTKDPQEARLRLSFDKVKRMTRSLRVNQFTSFTE